ncbi:hypothetical protein F4801DRAFT_216031 [Xylaria longipes]|nr:hypothetical protein F4801DRAFT_216031 [Xylaria longipes]
MEVVGAIASFIAIGQAIGATPGIIKILRLFTNASKELEALIDELECLYIFYKHLKENIDIFSSEQSHMHARIPQGNKHIAHEAGSLPSLNDDNRSTPLDFVHNGAIVGQSGMASPNFMPATEGILGRRCRCLRHTLRSSRQRNYSLQIPLPGVGFFSYQSQQVTGNQCKLNCYVATQSFVSPQFRVPIWLRRIAMDGTFNFGFPLNMYMALAPITQYRLEYKCQPTSSCMLSRKPRLS